MVRFHFFWIHMKDLLILHDTKEKNIKKYFRQLYRALFLVVFVVSGNLFQIEMGIIQKVLNLEIYIKWSPLAIAILFKMKKKKEKSEQNCGAEVRARPRERAPLRTNIFFQFESILVMRSHFRNLSPLAIAVTFKMGLGARAWKKNCGPEVRAPARAPVTDKVYLCKYLLNHFLSYNLDILS